MAYVALGFVVAVHTWRQPGTFYGGDGDPNLIIWELGWAPFAVGHLHNPFLTNYVAYPDLVNQMWNTSDLFPALLLWPVTAAFGPLATFNVIGMLAPAAGAFPAFATLRRYVQPTAAAAGGLLYGFSPLVINQLGAHIHVAVAFFPPLVLLALDELLVRQRRSGVVVGVLLGLAGACQLLTGAEAFATGVLMAAIGTLLLALLHLKAVPSRVGHAAKGLATAAAAGFALAAYPLYVFFFGPGRVGGLIVSPNVYVTDLVGLVVPTGEQHFHTAGAIATQLQFTGNMAEQDAYLGIPLLLLLAAAVVVLWRRSEVRWAGLLALTALVLSFGPHLHIDGRDTGLRLPWAVIERIPPFQDALPSRLAVYMFLGLAVVVAVFLDRSLRAGPAQRIAGGAATVVALLPLLPWQPPATLPPNPAFFRSRSVDRIPEGSVAVVVPWAGTTTTSIHAMLWQAESGYRFRMPEGFAIRPGPTGDPRPSELQSLLVALDHGQTVGAPAAVRSALAAFHVSTVIVGPCPEEHAAIALFAAALGHPPEATGGVYVFWDVTASMSSR